MEVNGGGKDGGGEGQRTSCCYSSLGGLAPIWIQRVEEGEAELVSEGGDRWQRREGGRGGAHLSRERKGERDGGGLRGRRGEPRARERKLRE